MKHGVTLFGVKVQSGKPAMLAGLFRHLDVPTGSSFTIEAADLFNDGEEDVLVQSMQLTHPMDDMHSILMGVYWKINPMSGLTWMDQPVHISGITPYVLPLRNFDGIKPFSLTPLEDTYLYRRQRLGIKLTPLVDEDQPVNITLFGYLEVELWLKTISHLPVEFTSMSLPGPEGRFFASSFRVVWAIELFCPMWRLTCFIVIVALIVIGLGVL
jgi:hypothetical protein